MAGSAGCGAQAGVAAAVDYLTGPAADFVTGADLVIDGGMISGIHWNRP